MKLYTPEKTVLMEVTAIKEHPDGLLIEGKIMGAMPMKAILRADQLRAGRSLISWRIIKKVIGMFFNWKSELKTSAKKSG